jgi:Transposase DDE domain
MQLIGYMRAYFHLPYRQTQGVVIAHASKEVPCIPDYSTISRRINRLEIKINEKLGNEIVIALDRRQGVSPTKDGVEKPIFDYEKSLYDALLVSDYQGQSIINFKQRTLSTIVKTIKPIW